MCFSAPASFIAGAALSAVGVVTIKKAERKGEVPFAMIPLLFGIQQIIEGFIWLSFRFDVPLLNAVMTYIYALFSHVLWPIFVPFSIILIESILWRKKVISAFQLVGIGVGLYLLYFILRSQVVSQIVGKSIVYNSPHFYVFWVMVFYFMATSVSCFFSSHKLVNVFGLLLAASALLAYQFFSIFFVSVWCYFAAILSLIVYLYFKYKSYEVKPPPQ